jgi:hypothetical protein
MPDQSASNDYSLTPVWIALAIVGAVFAPLAISGIEALIFGTRHVEELCESLGIHEALGRIYEPIVNLMR